MKTEESEVQKQSLIYSKFEASIAYLEIMSLKKRKKLEPNKN